MKVFMSIAGLRLAAPAVAEPTMPLLILSFAFRLVRCGPSTNRTLTRSLRRDGLTHHRTSTTIGM